MAETKVYYMYNGHGDVTTLLNETGAIVGTYYYDVWGNILEKNESEQITNPYRYAGYQYDDETGLYYLNARYYDAKIARFLTEDTVTGDRKDPLSLNRYSYCYNNPLIYTDPTGNIANMMFVDDGAGSGSSKSKKTTVTTKTSSSGNKTNKNGDVKAKINENIVSKELAAKYNAAKAQALKEKNTDKIDLKAATIKTAKEIGGGFVKGFDITLKVLALPGNVSRSVFSDIGKGNFEDVVPNAMKSVKGERQVSTLDLIISKKTQADLYEANATLYHFANNVAGTIDPMILVPAGKVNSMLDDVALRAKGIATKVESTVAKGTVDLKHPVIDNPRVGSGLKDDFYHSFDDMIDNYAVDAQRFDLPNKKGYMDDLYQIEGFYC